MHLCKSWCLIINKGIDIIVEVHYSFRKDIDSIPGENTNWEGKSNYTRKILAFYFNNRRGIPSRNQKKIDVWFGHTKESKDGEINFNIVLMWYNYHFIVTLVKIQNYCVLKNFLMKFTIVNPKFREMYNFWIHVNLYIQFSTTLFYFIIFPILNS